MPAMETTVLIADDHPLFREALRLVVAEALGAEAQTIECASLDEAREQVAHSPNIDLALMDLNMPGMDGLAGLASLRAHMPTLPIIVVSADERHATVDAALRAGVSGFIPKSFSRADMAAAVNAVLDGDMDALLEGQILANAQCYARDIANEPGNVINPETLEHKAADLAA